MAEFHFRRHPDKKGETLEPLEGEKLQLPVEGIIQTQAEAVKFAEMVKEGPENAVYLGYTSNQPRTSEADFIFGQEQRIAAKMLPMAKVFDRSAVKSLEEIATQVDESTGQVIIINSPEHPVMGMHDWDLEAVYKDLETMTENEVLAKWFEDPAMQAKYNLKPEQLIQEFKEFIKQKTEELQKLFPGRPAVISGIGHSWELDTAIFALMNKELSGKTLEEMGGMIGTMEGAKVVIDEEGKGAIEYRGEKVEINI